MEVIKTAVATMPPGPFSQAVRHNGIVYVAGQVAYDGASGNPVLGDIKEQTRQTLKNLTAVLEASGSSLDKVMKLTCILPNFPTDYIGFNETFREFFKGPLIPRALRFRAVCSEGSSSRSKPSRSVKNNGDDK